MSFLNIPILVQQFTIDQTEIGCHCSFSNGSTSFRVGMSVTISKIEKQKLSIIYLLLGLYYCLLKFSKCLFRERNTLHLVIFFETFWAIVLQCYNSTFMKKIGIVMVNSLLMYSSILSWWPHSHLKCCIACQFSKNTENLFT